MDKLVELSRYSNFEVAQKRAEQYLGKDAKIYLSLKSLKKYRIFDPFKCKFIDFGQMGYEDFTKHECPKRRKSYLARASNIKGDWQTNPYSPNNLSIHILW